MSLSTKQFVCLGLMGGAVFSLSVNAPAIAQVQITGGNFSGDAGFFLPDLGAEVKILDATVETLNLESAIGNTSTAVFTPTATRFDNNINPTMATVDSGDTGTLQGLLTGLAYDSDGYPVIFTSIPTQLDFAVNNFSVSNSLTGTLIQPEVVGAAPLVFINRAITLAAESDADFDAVAGQLDLGTLNADLNGGEFNLPSNWSFAGGSSSGGSSGSTGLERRIKFKFYGEDVTPEAGTDLTGGDRIRFIGAANEKFEIKTVGSRSNGEFKIKAKNIDNAFVDIVLGGPFSKIKGDATDIDITQELDYKIKGEATGNFTALLGNVSTVAEFSGTARRDIDFEFKQGRNKFEGESDGLVQFVAAIGGTELISNGNDNTNVGLGVCNVCNASTTTTTTTTTSTTQTVAVNARFLSIQALLDDNTDDPDATVTNTSGSANDLSTDEYEALQEQLAELDIDIDIDIDITVVDAGLERYYVAHPKKGKKYKDKYKYKGKGRGKKRRGYYENEVVCYRQVGPGSSIFPGLIGLVVVDFDDIPTDVFVGLPEVADADLGDDVTIIEGLPEIDDDAVDSDDDDDDDDDGDDDGDDDDDDDDGDDDGDDDDDDDDDSDVIIIDGLPETGGNSGGSSGTEDVTIIEGLPEISP